MNFLHIYSSFRNKREIYIRESERRDIEELPDILILSTGPTQNLSLSLSIKGECQAITEVNLDPEIASNSF